MKRLRTPQDVDELGARVRRLTPESQRQWGRMTAGQMVCHLSDAFRGPLGERPPSKPRDNLLTRTVIKWLVFRTPMPWARGAPTSPEIDQAAGAGTPPAVFAEDVSRLIDLMGRFVAQPDTSRRPPHSMFGPMNDAEWARWGWAHVDHHLRQFGV